MFEVGGLGGFKAYRRILGEPSVLLDLPWMGNINRINPASIVPGIELGLSGCMVSSVFSPGRITQLSLVAFLKPSEHLRLDVAVSISPSQSLTLAG